MAKCRKRRLTMTGIVIVAVMGAATLASGCGGGTDDGDEPAGAPVRIALIGPYSGPVSVFGEQAADAVELAADDYGVELDITRADTKCTPSTAVQAAQQALTNDPAAVLASPCSGDTAAIKQRLEQEQVPGCSYNTDEGIAGPYMWRVSTPSPVIDPPFAEYMGGQGYESMALIHERSAAGQNSTDTIRQTLEDAGVAIPVVASYEVEDTDYSGQLIRAKNANVDALYLQGFSLQVANLIKQSASLGLDIPTYIYLGGAGSTTPDVAGAAANGVEVGTSFLPDMNEAAEKLSAQWQKDHGVFPDVVAAGAYGCAAVLIQASRAAGPDASGEELNNEIAGLHLDNTPLGQIAFDEDGENAHPTVVVGVFRDGQPRLIETLLGGDEG